MYDNKLKSVLFFIPLVLVAVMLVFPSIKTTAMCIGAMFIYFDMFIPHRHIRDYICLSLGLLLFFVGVFSILFPSKTYFLYSRVLSCGVMLLVGFLGVCIIEFSYIGKLYKESATIRMLLRLAGGTVSVLSIILAISYIIAVRYIEIFYFGSVIGTLF